MFVNVDRYGNTSAASVAIALDEAVDSGRVAGRRQDSCSSPSGPASRAARWRSPGPPTPRHRARGRRRRAGGQRARPRSTGTPSTRCRRGWPPCSRPGARPCRSTTSCPASPSTPARRSAHDRPVRQERRRHGRLARHRPRHRACASRTQGADVCFSYRGERRGRGETPSAPSRRSVGAALAVQADVSDPERGGRARQGRPGGLRQGRHPGQQRGHHARRPDHAHERRRRGATSSRPTSSARSTPSRPSPGRCSRRAAAASSTSPACRARRARWARPTTRRPRPGSSG